MTPAVTWLLFIVSFYSIKSCHLLSKSCLFLWLYFLNLCWLSLWKHVVFLVHLQMLTMKQQLRPLRTWQTQSHMPDLWEQTLPVMKWSSWKFYRYNMITSSNYNDLALTWPEVLLSQSLYKWIQYSTAALFVKLIVYVLLRLWILIQLYCTVSGPEDSAADTSWSPFDQWVCLWDHAVLLPYLLWNAPKWLVTSNTLYFFWLEGSNLKWYYFCYNHIHVK